MGIDVKGLGNNGVGETVEGTGEERMFLNKHSLVANVESIKIAYIEKIQESVTSEQKPFYKFYFRDRDSNVVVGRMFLHEDKDFGESILGLHRCIVRVHFTTQIFNGDVQLIVQDVRDVNEGVCSTDEYFRGLQGVDEAYTKVMEYIKGVDKKFSMVLKIIENNKLINRMKSMKCYRYYGSQGGSILVLEEILNILHSTKVDKLEKDKETVLGVVAWYFKCLRYEQLIGGNDEYDLGTSQIKILLQSEKFWTLVEQAGALVPEVPIKFVEDLTKEGRHMYNVMMGIDTPKTLATKLVMKAIDMSEEVHNLVSVYSELGEHSYRYLNDTDYIVKCSE